MFDLEKAIAEWRSQIASVGVKSKETLDELETHLRDDIEQEMRAGLAAEPAFKIASERIGDVMRLKDEFAKIDRAPREILRKLKKLLMGGERLELPSINAFTPGAQQALALAREEAPLLNHDFIGTEHVLLGLLKSQSDIVPGVMRRLGVQSETIRAEIEKIIGPGIPVRRVAAEIPYTPRAKRALNLAVKEAELLEQQQVKPEHILLGLIKENEGVAWLVLRNLGVDIERARDEIVREMDFRKGVD
jgi:Clp amino terminal domain, pathogenicity island component